MKTPLPPKKTELMATGGSSLKNHRLVLTSNIAKRSPKGENKQPADAEKDSTGCSIRPSPTRCNRQTRSLYKAPYWPSLLAEVPPHNPRKKVPAIP
jgi:hypothetical protein